MSSGVRDGRRDRLVYYAKEAFAREGYYATSISQIVQQAGIARGTFYQYFDNKLHIFQSILDSFIQDLQECIRPVFLAVGALDPRVQIEDNLSRVLELVLRERDLTRILLHHASTPDRALERRLTDFYSQVAGMLERSLNLGIAMNLVRSCNTRLTAYSIIGAVKEVVFQLTSSQEQQPPVEGLVQELMEFGMQGIIAEPRTALSEGNSRVRRAAPLPGATTRPLPSG